MRLWRVLQAFIMLSADGVMVCSCRVVSSAVGVAYVGSRCCLLFGVRMARTGFSVCRYIFIY